MASTAHDLPAILRAILPGYTLPLHGTHGVTHWARVLENGLRLCEATGADPEVVTLFAIFHDARRVNEYRDDGHGHRGADLAASLRGTLVHLADRDFELLYEACRRHTDGGTTGELLMQMCWDADRLDLGRVGIRPQPTRLCTTGAHDLIDWAHERAVDEHVPDDVLQAWGLGETEPPDFYFENGLLVYSAAYHLKRGSCCGSGCRHCPFEPKHIAGNRKVRE